MLLAGTQRTSKPSTGWELLSPQEISKLSLCPLAPQLGLVQEEVLRGTISIRSYNQSQPR